MKCPAFSGQGVSSHPSSRASPGSSTRKRKGVVDWNHDSKRKKMEESEKRNITKYNKIILPFFGILHLVAWFESQLISAHLSSKYHEFQWNLEFWCGHVQMDHHGSEDICLKRFRVTFGWNQPEFLCFCAIEIDRSAEEPSKFTDFWIYADTQKNTINDLPWSTPFGILVEAQPALSHHRFIRRDMLWWIVITSWAWSMVWCLADDIGNRSSEGLFLPQFAEGQG